jgi:hypothetical protein
MSKAAVFPALRLGLPSGSRSGTVQVPDHGHRRSLAHSRQRFGYQVPRHGEGHACSSARAWVVKFTHRRSRGLGSPLKGPAGFKCQSFSEAASGDKLVYAGVCRHTPHNIPFFGWAAKQ